MADDLYIFVDESGHHARGAYYTVAGCWCLSNNNPRHILDSARARLSRDISEVAGIRNVDELKGSQLPKESLGSFLDTFEKFAYEDGTVSGPPYPWQHNRPFQCSYHSFNPEVGKQILANYMAEADAPHVLQRLSLARILSPLTDANVIDLSQINNIHVIPDAEVWKTPANEVCSLFAELDGLDINVETRDSSRTPGIQIADLIAYSRRSYMKDYSCEDAANFIDNRHL